MSRGPPWHAQTSRWPPRSPPPRSPPDRAPVASPVPHPSTPRLTFKASHRLRHDLEFERVYKARVKKVAGPLVLHALPNALAHHRLGLSIGRRVGPAVRRVLLKRHLREAFRLLQHDLPSHPSGGYDLVVGASPHAPLDAAAYCDLLLTLATQAHRVWQKRAAP